MKRSPGLSLVMPAYNEEANVGAATRACAAAGEKFAENYEVVNRAEPLALEHYSNDGLLVAEGRC